MKDWWLGKTQREQLALVGGAAAVLLLLLYLLAWQPFVNAVEKQRTHVKNQQITLDWMQQVLPEFQSLSSQNRAAGNRQTNEALLTLVDRTAKQKQLREQFQRLKPQGDDTVQLWVEQAPFDTLLNWLGNLTSQYGIQIETLNIDRQELPGIVNARLVLQRAGGA
jgi:general secretion pathway protein M